MGLRMKNFNISGVHWKIQLSGGRRGGIVCKFRGKGGAWQEKGSGVFEGGGVDTPMHTMVVIFDFFPISKGHCVFIPSDGIVHQTSFTAYCNAEG